MSLNGCIRHSILGEERLLKIVGLLEKIVYDKQKGRLPRSAEEMPLRRCESLSAPPAPKPASTRAL